MPPVYEPRYNTTTVKVIWYYHVLIISYTVAKCTDQNYFVLYFL